MLKNLNPLQQLPFFVYMVLLELPALPDVILKEAQLPQHEGSPFAALHLYLMQAQSCSPCSFLVVCRSPSTFASTYPERA